jgi:dipeptidyl aminopeptidase/acylaminoacyl peptidase
MTRLLSLVCLLTFTFTTTADQASPSIEQMLSLKWPRSAVISPDGRYVVCEVQRTNWDSNSFETELWLAVPRTGKSFALTTAKGSSRNPRWSPDGQRLAFISDRSGTPQIYLIPPDGGEAAVLTDHETGVIRCEWAPDGESLAFTAVDPPSQGRRDKQDKYGTVEVFETPPARTHLWQIATPSELPSKPTAARRLTEGDDFSIMSSPTASTSGFAWSPDGERIAFTAGRSSAPRDSGTLDIHLLDVRKKSVVKLVTTAGPDRNPVWSPDGKLIAFESSNDREDFMPRNSSLCFVSALGGKPRMLTAALDESPSLHAWSPEGLYFSALTRTEHHLYRVDIDGEAPVRVGTANAHAGFFATFAHTFTSDFRQTAFVFAGRGQYPEACLAKLSEFQTKPLSNLGSQLSEYRLGGREVVQWKSTDGTIIEGVLTKPPDFQPGKKYPLLVIIHGGPAWLDTAGFPQPFAYPLVQFAAKGALILQPNYRGSVGYGEKFRSLNVRNLGVGDAEDVISGVDFLIATGAVDRDRVGVMGWSQGGYISAFLTCSSDRFKAVSVGAGISDWTTYYCNTDIPAFTRQYLKATPWDDPDIYRKTSPISYLKSAKTPTLIQHGDRDERVPIANAHELYRGLKDREVLVKLMVFKGHDHIIFKPREQRALMEQNLEWFSEHIWGEKPRTDR